MSEQTMRNAGNRPSVRSGAETTEDLESDEEARSVREEVVAGYHELEQRYNETRDAVYDVNRRAVDFIEENPALAIGAAFGVGFLVGKFASKRWFT